MCYTKSISTLLNIIKLRVVLLGLVIVCAVILLLTLTLNFSNATTTPPDNPNVFAADQSNGNRNEKLLMEKSNVDGQYIYTATTEISGHTLLGAVWAQGNEQGGGPGANSASELPQSLVQITTSTFSNDVWSVPEVAQDDLYSQDNGSDPILINHNGQVQLQLKTSIDLGDNVNMSVIVQTKTTKDEEIAASKGDIPIEQSNVAVQGTLSTMGVGDQPAIHSRAEWGGDDAYSSRAWPPKSTVYHGVVVHHTTGSNNYEPGEVPGILRAIYLYHTLDQNWGDIGYNFLVDKYGGIWEGRMGGVTNAIIGAHAKKNANETTFGVSLIGNYETARPTNAAIQALTNIIHWKFALHGIDPHGTGWIGDEWGFSTKPTIVGHRDVNSTTCPGQYLYQYLDAIRNAGFSPEGALDVVKVDDDGTLHVRGWAVDRDNTDLSIDVHIYVGGPAGTGIGEGFVTTAKTSRPDVDEVLGYGTHHGFDFVIKPSIQGANIPIYAYGINIAGTPGKNRLIGQKTVQIVDPNRVAVWRAAKMEGGYFYTTNPDEYLTAIKQGMRAEGLVFYTVSANTPGAVPLYRAAKLNGAGYFYTTDWAEYQSSGNYNMRHEGLAFYVLPAGGSQGGSPIYRGAQVVNQGYIYTSNWDEYANALPANNYRQEGEVFRVW